MSLIETPELFLIERFLDLATARQTLLASNIANVDTPGYRTQDIDFHAELARALEEDPEEPVRPMAQNVRGLIERPDGNNVSVDRDGLMLAELQLKYQSATQALKAEFTILRDAIEERAA
jgi:flagellar basal-body rod protein FlgB